MAFYVEKKDSKNQISTYHKIDFDRLSLLKKDGKYFLKIDVNSYKDKQSCDDKYQSTMTKTYAIEYPEFEKIFTLENLTKLLKLSDDFKDAREVL